MMADGGERGTSVYVCANRAFAATRFDKWARGGMTLSLDGAGEGK